MVGIYSSNEILAIKNESALEREGKLKKKKFVGRPDGGGGFGRASDVPRMYLDNGRASSVRYSGAVPGAILDVTARRLRSFNLPSSPPSASTFPSYRLPRFFHLISQSLEGTARSSSPCHSLLYTYLLHPIAPSSIFLLFFYLHFV